MIFRRKRLDQLWGFVPFLGLHRRALRLHKSRGHLWNGSYHPFKEGRLRLVDKRGLEFGLTKASIQFRSYLLTVHVTLDSTLLLFDYKAPLLRRIVLLAMEDQSRERIAAFIAQANSLLAKLTSWQLGLPEAPATASKPTEESSTAPSAPSTQRGTPKHVEGMAKFRRRIQAEIDFLSVRFTSHQNVLSS